MADVKDLKVSPPVNRFQGSLPKIGIRPTIDGRRRGVRESLEGLQSLGKEGSIPLLKRRLR